ncbi:MAG: murein biosynthesis integral membrane protein MurJ [Anaerolineae bacterium]|nr:murein biosynthesis integral membrane protein MurJ [Anaerolineae bacterium]
MVTSIIEKLKLTRTSFNALLVIFLFGFDKVLAFVRTGIISRQYRDEVHLLDTFNAANNLPDVLFALISGGALAMAFIPLLTEYLTKKDRAAAWDLFSRVANLAFVVTAGFAILIAIFAEQIAARVIAPGFPAEQLDLLADLMRLNLIATIIFSISGLVMASLQANQHFLMPGLAPAAYNIGQILGAIFLVPVFGIQGLVYGVILGASMHLLIQVPALFIYGFRWTPSLDLSNTGLNEALRLMWPRLLTMGGIQMIVILRDNFASRLQQDGAVTALTYGWMIMQVPQTLIGTAIATAMLPALSELAARQDWKEFGQAVERALRVLIATSLPLAVIMAAGLHPLVRGVFGFGEEISLLITWTARAFLLTLLGYNIHELAVRSFYARKEPLMPLFAVLLRLFLFSMMGLAAVYFLRSIGAPMIALAEISLLVEAIVLFFLLSRKTHEPLRVGRPLVLSFLASAVGGTLTYFIAVYLPGGAISTALIGIAAGGLAALAIVWSEVKLLFRL